MIFDKLAKKYGVKLTEKELPIPLPPISARQHQTVSETQNQIEELIKHLNAKEKGK
jgi:hypothetical protein